MTDTHASGDRFGDDLDALAELLAAEGIGAGDDVIAPRAAGDPVPMSFSQELLWLLDRASPGMTAYNLPMARRLRGALDVDALQRALTAIATRHEALRTRFAEQDGEARQIIDAPAPVALNVVDLSHAAESTRDAEAQRVVRDRFRATFDLSNEHCFRVTLVRLAPDDHVLVLESHHVVLDGWSMGIVLRELSEAYTSARAGRDASLPAQRIQYGDYAIWQRRRLAGARLEALLSFWRGQLGDATEPLALPTDFARDVGPGFSGARESIVVDRAALDRLKAAAQAADATLYMVLVAAYGTVLHRYTGRENVLIGSGSAGRTEAETEGLVGYLNNTIVQRTDFSGDPSFADLLGRVRESALGAYDHQDIPLEKLVRELRQGDALSSHAPLFEVVLTMQDIAPSTFALDGMRVESFGADMGATKFDITLFPFEHDGGLGITAQYRSDLFAPATMQRFLGHLRRVLDAFAADPGVRVSRIDMLTPEEAAQIAQWNATDVQEGTPATLTALFEAQASRVASRPAVVSGGASLTYSELNARANQVAHHLRGMGVVSGARVGLLIDRSADAIVGMLGILKAGAAYVPLSVDAPPARLAQQVADCGASIVVTTSSVQAKLPPDVRPVAFDDAGTATSLSSQPAANQGGTSDATSLAYVLFTSGSTGTPKGVAVTHANAVHYARAVSRVLGDTPVSATGDGCAALDGRQFAMASTLAADLGNTSLLVSLICGGTLHVLAADMTTDPAAFAAYVESHPIDILKITPSHLAALTAGRTGRDLARVLPSTWVVVGGEALRPDVARTLLGAGSCRVLNHYGPTETTVGVCTFEVTQQSLDEVLGLGAQTIPVGRPLANTRAYIIDGRSNDMPIAMPGELVIGGAGVTRGYLGRDDLTAERFTELRGDRVYRTGDRARRLSNGAIEFLGRTDDQIKVRGYRVEPGEIEQVLCSHSAIAQSTVMLRGETGTDQRLVAYVVPKRAGYEVAHAERVTPDALREWVADRVPEYMVPAAIVLLDAIPLTANGKIDRAKLPDPGDAGTAQPAYVAPRSDVETQLAAIWAEVLKKERVGVTDNFLDLGGHSLMAIRVLGKISKTFGVRMPIRVLFDSPTVEQLAVAVTAEKARSAPAAAIGARSRDAFRVDAARPGGSGDADGGPK